MTTQTMQTVKSTRVPALGFGTYKLTGEACVEGVEHALSLGYRHIDTAQAYNNETEVGRGVARAGVSRDKIFLTTKVPPDNFSREKVLASTRESLKRLQTDYVNLLLMHWPNPEVPLEETLEAMLELQGEGAVEHIGVSNFPPSLVEKALETAPIFCNQVEYHPYLSQEKLTGQARERDYLLTAYSPIARGKVLDDPTLRDIGERYDKTPAQVTLRWLVQQPRVAAIPKASSEAHRKSNFAIFDFELSDEEMRLIHALGGEERLVDPAWGPDWER